jgi:hypothetical protein
MANDIASMERIPAVYAILGELIAIEALLATGASGECQERLEKVALRIQPCSMSGTWGEFLRLRGRIRAADGRASDAYHDFGQSVSIFELLGERYQAGLSYLELGRLAATAGARSRASRYLTDAQRLFSLLDSMFRMPLADVLERVNLAPEAREALLDRTGPFGDALNFVEAYELGLWEQAGALGKQLGVPEEKLSSIYTDAVKFAPEQLAPQSLKAA